MANSQVNEPVLYSCPSSFILYLICPVHPLGTYQNFLYSL